MFEEEEEESVEFVEAIEYTEEITWGAVGQESQQVAESGC